MTSATLNALEPQRAAALDLRVLFVIPAGPDSSSYIFSKRQASMIEAAGVSARTFFVQSRTSPRVLAGEWARLRREIQDFKPSVVHAQYGTMNGLLAALATRAPLVITFRGSDLNPVPSFGRVRTFAGHMFSNLAALKADSIICVSEELKSRLWWARDRARVITGGVNLDLFQPMERLRARRQLGWMPDAPTVLFNAGRYPRVKRIDLAEAAVATARRIRPEIRMIIVRGEVEPDLMPVYYSAADCLLITSDWEGSPTVIKEALACNLPVVSVAVGDAADRLRDVEPSEITSRDPEDLARALLRILETGRRANGRAVVAGLDEYAEAQRICHMYETIIRNR